MILWVWVHGSLIDVGISVEGSSAWVSDQWVSNRMGLSRWLFFFFLFRFLMVMRLWVCDFGGLFFLFLFPVVGGEW